MTRRPGYETDAGRLTVEDAYLHHAMLYRPDGRVTLRLRPLVETGEWLLTWKGPAIHLGFPLEGIDYELVTPEGAAYCMRQGLRRHCCPCPGAPEQAAAPPKEGQP